MIFLLYLLEKSSHISLLETSSLQISFRTVRLVNTPQQEQELGYFVRPILRQSSIGFIAKQTMLVDIVNDSDFWTSDL